MFNSPYHGHHRQILQRTPARGDHSPWGTIQEIVPLIHGVTMVSTSSHGGFHLTPQRLRMMPQSMRSSNGWYEEDCEVAMVMYCFYDEFATLNLWAKAPTREELAHTIREYCGLEV